jgi:hypothetical protein
MIEQLAVQAKLPMPKVYIIPLSVNPLTGGGLMSLFSTHPPMEERISRLESLATGRN